MAALKLSKLQALQGQVARRAFNRVLIFVFALAVVSMLKFFYDSDIHLTPIYAEKDDYGCNDHSFFPGRFLKPFSFYPFNLPQAPAPCDKAANITSILFKQLVDLRILTAGARSLCLGDGSSVAISVLQRLGCENLVRVGSSSALEFKDNSFDFVFATSLDHADAPALLVHEIERVLRQNGSAAVLTRRISSSIKLRSLVSSLLKDSDIVHLSQVEELTVVAFKKRVAIDELHRCHESVSHKNFIEQLEPLVKVKPQLGLRSNFTYLSNLIDISGYRKLAYIEFSNTSIDNWFSNSYPTKSKVFDLYVVGENKAASDDFLGWFEETVSGVDFAVVKTGGEGRGLGLIREIMKTGAMCRVDELFLRCGDALINDGCFELVGGLRRNGVFAHLW